MAAGNGHHLEHPALLYESREDFLEYMVPYVTAGLENREVVFVAARADNLAALGKELGERAGGARLADTGEWHPHTGTRLRAFYELVTDELEAGATGIRLAGEPVWPDGPAELIREGQRYESVLNWVLGPFPVTLVCLYDASRLDPSILEVSHVTHPVVGRDGREQPSGEFADPEEFLRRWNHALSPPPAWAVRTTELGDLSAARWLLGDLALAAGVHPDRVSDLVSAANEALINAEVHGNGAVALWAWSEDGRFVCQIEDRGHGIADPLAGYRPPSVDTKTGRGLWIARQLVDLLQVAPGSDGTTVRLQVQAA